MPQKMHQEPHDSTICAICTDFSLLSHKSTHPNSPSWAVQRWSFSNKLIQPQRMGCPILKAIEEALKLFSPLSGEQMASTEDIVVDYSYQCGISIKYGHPLCDNRYTEIYSLEDYTHFQKRNHIPSSALSETTLSNIANWILDCDTTHSSCPKFPQTLPTRVIDLGPSTNQAAIEKPYPRLYTTRDHDYSKNSRYISLSHCWGQGVPMKTLTSNLALFHNTIPLNGLPRTFQDTLNISKRLGIRYVWIDALCIVQDDQKDWHKEASSMASIYERSAFTICVMNGMSSDSGFLSKRSQYHMIPSMKGLFVRLATGLKDAHRFGSRRLYVSGDKPEAILLSRAWTFQEQLLSPRLLSFFDSEVIWSCNTSTVCECGNPWDLKTGSWEPSSLKYEYGRIQNENLTEIKIPTSIPMMINPDWRLWQKIVEQYSPRIVSFQKDRLWALSGIARTFSGRLGNYHAGLWSDSILEGLEWKRLEDCFNPEPGHRLNLSIPTWSWASVDQNPVWWDRHSWDLEPIWNAEVRDIKTFSVSEDPFGETSGGYISLRSKCFKFIRRGDELEPAERIDYELPGLYRFNKDVTGSDTIISTNPQEVLGCILRCAEILNADSRNDQDFIVTLLVLEKVEPSNAQSFSQEHCWPFSMNTNMAQSCYKRIGFIETNSPIGYSHGGKELTYFHNVLRWEEIDITII
ncbi:heterokaryon incompatibility protein-domain-containing protein [Tricladium varicosporioides]|nr:heterokaryon incompatibility protein-domain-containing protein [Hymenoscyphus varicosporioides]